MATSLSPEVEDSVEQSSNNEDEKNNKGIDDLLKTDTGESESEVMSALQYEKVMSKRVAFFSGAFHDGCPVLCVPSSGLRHLEGDPPVLDDFDSTLTYLKPLLSSDHLTSGIVILLDGRKPTQSAVVKLILERVSSDEFPLKCHTLFLMKASQLSQLSNVTFYFSKSKTKLVSAEIREKINVVSLKDRDDLYEHIPHDQLTEDFGGSLDYNHQQWFKNAVIYEKVQKLRSKILTKFPDVRDGLNEFQLPQSIKDAERLMQQHLKLKEFFVNLFAEIDLLIDELMDNLKNQQSEHSVVPAVGALTAAEVLVYLNKTNEEIKEEQAEFEKFWSLHKQHLDHMMRVCHYKKTVDKVRKLMSGHIDDMTTVTTVTGENLESALELGEKHENFVSTCKEKMDAHLKDIREESVELCNLPSADTSVTKMLTQCIEGVKEGANSLTELYQKLMKLCQQKRDLYIVAVKFHMTIRQCDQWCAGVKEFTEYPPSADTTSSEQATEMIEHSDSLMKQMTQKNLNTVKELGGCLPEKEVKKLVSKTLQKCKTSREKLEEYRNKLLQIIALSYAPPTPPQKMRIKDSPSSSLKSSGSLPSLTEEQSMTPPTSSVITATPTSAPPPLPSTQPNHTPSDVSESFQSSGSDKPDGSSSTHQLVASIEYINDEECDPAILRKREYVYKEIVETEKGYIGDLKIILDSYYYEMDDENRVPLRLRGKKDVIFSNLKDIYEFHNDVFLKQIEFYSDHPERIGVCFIQHKEQFRMYSKYCRNRPNSEALLVQSPECQSFFKEIQIRLAHQLPLNSFLIKPIQRITKYQLLLKDMIKYCSNTTQALTDLQTALDMMLTVLKNLNDSLHVVGLKGFPGSLAEQGRLLVHDPFQVWEGAEHARHRLSRNHERHVFLFERVVIFSKKKEATSNQQKQQKKENKSDAYFYKSHVHLSDVQLKELPDDGPLVFGLSLIGGNKLTRLQASSKDIKEMWVSELKRLLKNQFGLLKDIVLQSGTLDRAAVERYSRKGGNPRGRTNLFDQVPPMESKKSFSERFKFNIKQKKNNSDLKSPNQPNKAIMTTSLGGGNRTKIVRDDNSLLTTTTPPVSKSLRARTKSHEDLLDASGSSDIGGRVGVVPGQRSLEEEEWSNDEDEERTSTTGSATDHFESLAPGTPCLYVAIADYHPSDEDNGVPLTKGQEVELIGINQYSGWWWVRSSNYYSNDSIEGWVPASFLQISEFN